MGNREPWKTPGWEQLAKLCVKSISVGFGGAEMEAEAQLLQNQGEEWRCTYTHTYIELGQYIYKGV